MFLAGEHRKDGPVFGAMLCEGEASRLQQGTRQKKKHKIKLRIHATGEGMKKNGLI